MGNASLPSRSRLTSISLVVGRTSARNAVVTAIEREARPYLGIGY